jgi:phosphohistidine swiveling domain-containing protein
MSKQVVSEHQPSLTEWFAAIGENAQADAVRKEDSERAERSEVLYQTFGLPYERPEPFPAREVYEKSPAFQAFLEERGSELCAFRLVPTEEGLPKLRNRGLTIRQCYEEWFLQQNIDLDKYTVYVCPHCDELQWAGIFMVTQDLIFGEVVRGKHNQLTQGETNEEPLRFQYDFTSWSWSKDDAEAKAQVQRMVDMVRISKKDQAVLAEKLQSTFTHDYLMGYLETTVWPEDKLYFIDYNRVLPRYISTPPPLPNTEASLQGMTAFPGEVTGSVVTMTPEEVGSKEFPEGSILVCDNTDVRYLPIMKKAAGIVTERGGILSHAAIISRELKTPCVVGCRNLLNLVHDNDTIKLDATHGTITQL